MGASVDDVELCLVHSDLEEGSTTASKDEVVKIFESKFDSFDVYEAQCFDPVQRDQLLGIIGACGSLFTPAPEL